MSRPAGDDDPPSDGHGGCSGANGHICCLYGHDSNNNTPNKDVHPSDSRDRHGDTGGGGDDNGNPVPVSSASGPAVDVGT